MSEASSEGSDHVRTGVSSVDDVLETVAGLDARDLAEHPAVFEDAQDRLRRALDEPDELDET